MEKEKQFLQAVERRRTRYALTDRSPVSDDKIEEIISFSVKAAPSAFNSQGARLLVLFGVRHKEFWNLVRESLKAVVPAEKFAPTEEKLASFGAGRGTILFF